MSEQVSVAEQDGILTLRFNRPEKKNALTRTMYTALGEALQRAGDDPAVRVVLLTGSAGCFTSGNDILDFMQGPPLDEASPVARFLASLVSLQKPIVAAVNGVAIGVGTTMLLHCDLVYAGDDARFQLPFVNLGLVPEAGSSLILPYMVGHQRAAELLLLGEPFDAEIARAVGFVNDVVPAADVERVALEKAYLLAAKAPAALRLAKQLLKGSMATLLQETMAAEFRYFAQQLQSPEAAEAFQAFMERRKPDFSRFS